MGKSKSLPTVKADENNPSGGDANDESSQGQRMLLNLYENLQAELKEVRLHLLKVETESSLREMKLFQDVSALEKLVEEQGLQIHQLEQQNNVLAGIVVDLTRGTKVSLAELDSDPTSELEVSAVGPESDVLGIKLVAGIRDVGFENMLMEVPHKKREVLYLDRLPSQDLVDERSPECSEEICRLEEGRQGEFGDVGGDCIIKLESVNFKEKESLPETRAVFKVLEMDNRNEGSGYECTGEVQDCVREDVDFPCIVTKDPDVGSSIVGNNDFSLTELPEADSKVPGSDSIPCGENVGTVDRCVGESSGSSALVLIPIMEAVVKVVWTINDAFSTDSDVIKFVDEVLTKHEGFCSSYSKGFEDLFEDKEDLAETDVNVDELIILYNPDEAERLEKDPEGSESVTETAGITKKLNLDFQPMTVKRLEKKRGLHRTNAVLLCPKKLDPRGRCCRLPQSQP